MDSAAGQRSRDTACAITVQQESKCNVQVTSSRSLELLSIELRQRRDFFFSSFFFYHCLCPKKKRILHTEACSWDPSFLASTTTVEAWKKNLYTSSWKPESTQYPRMGLFLKYSKNPEKQKHRQSSYKYMCYRSGWNCCILAKYFFLHVFMHRTKVVVKIYQANI